MSVKNMGIALSSITTKTKQEKKNKVKQTTIPALFQNPLCVPLSRTKRNEAKAKTMIAPMVTEVTISNCIYRSASNISLSVASGGEVIPTPIQNKAIGTIEKNQAKVKRAVFQLKVKQYAALILTSNHNNKHTNKEEPNIYWRSLLFVRCLKNPAVIAEKPKKLATI